MYGPEVLRARAWAAVSRGHAADGCASLEDAAAMARAGGGCALESAALHDLARLGHAGKVARRLRALAEVVEGPLAPARATHAAALVARDALGLEGASVAFEDLGAMLLAAEAAADAATAWQRMGEARRRVAAERRAHRLAGRCEGARTPALTAVAARATLTHRELEIVRLAATGATSREIAGRLHVSVRTVDNLLHAAYQKLGISGRVGLADVLEGL
jgi:DNA-binding CsgD family transcriptional regulator